MSITSGPVCATGGHCQSRPSRTAQKLVTGRLSSSTKRSGIWPPLLKRSSTIRPSLLELPDELAHQLGLAVDAGVRHVDVAHPPARRLGHAAAVALDPRRGCAAGTSSASVLTSTVRAPSREGRSLTRELHRPLRQTVEGGPGVLRGVERHAVDRQQVVALLHVHAGRAQRRAHLAVPGGAVDDVGDAEGAVLQGEVGAQQADAPLQRLLQVAAAAVGVRGVQLADQLADDEVDVLAACSPAPRARRSAGASPPSRRRACPGRRTSRARSATRR